MSTVSFPGLGLNFTINRVAFSIGNWSVYWYGIIIVTGLLLALIYAMKRSRFFGITVDDLSDITIFGIIFGIIGARLYYVLFYVDPTGANPYFADPKSMLYIWNGGLGIYGGIVSAFLTAFIVCRIKKISSGAVFDIAGLGFLIGQGIGRWGNFINQEAYGGPTNLPWRMVVSNAVSPVHPCFFYESMWCLIGFILLHIYSKRRKFNGEIFLMYVCWYAFGRFFIEGLRSDSLMIGNIKVSQLVAVVLFMTAAVFWIYKRVTLKKAVIEENAEYNPLFEETSKAVSEDVEKQENELEKSFEADGEEVKSQDIPENEDTLENDSDENSKKTEEDQ